MSGTLTDAVEFAVGLGCVVAAVAAARTPRLRWLAVVLAIAGAAAIVHAIVELTGRG